MFGCVILHLHSYVVEVAAKGIQEVPVSFLVLKTTFFEFLGGTEFRFAYGFKVYLPRQLTICFSKTLLVLQIVGFDDCFQS